MAASLQPERLAAGNGEQPMRLHHGIVARSSRCGSLVTSLLCASMALAETLDPAEHLAFWIDEGTTPSASAEVWPVGQRFLQDDELVLESVQPIGAMAIDGELTIDSDQGHVRVTLVDTELREHLVAEFYPLMTGQDSLRLEDVCRESCLLGNVTPHRLRIDLEEATLRIEGLRVLVPPAQPISDLAERQHTIRYAQAGAIVDRINEQIAIHHLGWEAGVNEYALRPFQDRRLLAPSGEVPVLHGFEYYVGGVYKLPHEAGDTGGGPGAGELITRFDWRKRHRATQPTSPYFDGDTGPSGWMTPVTKQDPDCHDCWAHAAIGLLEGHVNLVLNRHRDIKLSEQDILSCSGAGTCENGGSLYKTLRYLVEEGAVTNRCFPYTAENRNCGLACDDPVLRVRIARMLEIVSDRATAFDERVVKRALLKHGPLAFKRGQWWHYMVLVGFDRDSRTGRTVWIVKNSWGKEWGNEGFGRFVSPASDLQPVYAVEGVQLLNRGSPVGSRCRDEDGDGYAVWGFGLSRPSSCPSRDGLPDCNDDNPQQGPMLASGHCAIIEDLEPTIEEPEPDQSGATAQDAAAATPDTAAGGGGGGGGAAGGLLILIAASWVASTVRHRPRIPADHARSPR